MKIVTSIKELRQEYSTVHSVSCGDNRFIAQAVMFLCEIANAIKTPHIEKEIIKKPIRKSQKKNKKLVGSLLLKESTVNIVDNKGVR